MISKADKSSKPKHITSRNAAPEIPPSEIETQTDDITMSDAGFSLETQETQESQEDTQVEDMSVLARAHSPDWEIGEDVAI